MKSNQIKISIIILALVFTAAMIAVAAPRDNATETGKKGEITLDSVTTVGTLTLQPGRYRVQHRVLNSEHVVTFEPLAGGEKGDAKCTVETLKGKSPHTQVFASSSGNTKRMVKLEIGGDKGAYVF